LRIGTDGRGNYFARAGTPTEPGASIYAINIDLGAEFPVEPMVWRDRTLGLLPTNARVTGLKLNELAPKKLIVDATFDANGSVTGTGPAMEAAQKFAKLLPNAHARRFRPESFNPEDRAWKYQLDVSFAVPAGGAAAEQTENRTLLIGERAGAAEQLAGSRELNATFELDQALLDAFWPLAEGRTDPGPAPEPKK
jgi:hypothetical protein